MQPPEDHLQDHLKQSYLEQQCSNNRQHLWQHRHLKVHLLKFKQHQYLMHLKQYIVPHANATINLVVHHHLDLSKPHWSTSASRTSISVDSSILQVATNIDSVEQQLQEDLVKQTVEPQDFYEDDLSQYTSDDIKVVIASDLHSLGKKNIYGEVDIDSLTGEHRRHIIKTRWVIRHRLSSTSIDDIDDTAGPLKARFVAKGYSQHIEDYVRQMFAATPAILAKQMNLELTTSCVLSPGSHRHTRSLS